MNDFVSVLDSCVTDKKDARIRRERLTTLQVNLGNLCNQRCKHCHIDASPQGKNIMSRRVVDNILRFLFNNCGLILDITGGTPELNPHFDYLVNSARPLAKEIIVRSNLTVILEPGREYLSEFFRKNNVHLICSLPCYTKENVESQRGEGVFEKSIRILRLLNDLGFARRKDLQLDLVYNPGGANLPPRQKELEKDYKHILKKDYDIEFNKLITITNVPINRFKNYLQAKGEYENYLNLLQDNFNREVLTGLMCRTFLSVGYDGKLYDCDFNQALCLPLKDKIGDYLTLDKLNTEGIEGQDVILGNHCFACTAGYGSSCQGSLINKEESENAPRKDGY